MAAGRRAGEERGSRERRRRRAEPSGANGARAGGSLKPVSGARGPARLGFVRERPGPACPGPASPARSHGRDRGLLRQTAGASPHGGERGEAAGAGHAPGGCW